MYYLSACNRGNKQHEKQRCYKESKSLIFFFFFWCHQTWPNVSFKSLSFSIYGRLFLVEKWRTLERARRYANKMLLNLDCQDSFLFRRIIWEKFLLPLSAKRYDRNFKCSLFWIYYFLLCHFLMSWSLQDWKHINRYIFHYFL